MASFRTKTDDGRVGLKNSISDSPNSPTEARLTLGVAVKCIYFGGKVAGSNPTLGFFFSSLSSFFSRSDTSEGSKDFCVLDKIGQTGGVMKNSKLSYGQGLWTAPYDIQPFFYSTPGVFRIGHCTKCFRVL